MEINAETNQRLNDALAGLLDTLQKGGELAADQLPLLAQEIAIFGFWSNLISYILITLVFAVFATIFFTSVSKTQKEFDVSFNVAVISGIIATAMFCFFMEASLSSDGSLWSCIKSATAPRLYVVEYVTNLLK